MATKTGENGKPITVISNAETGEVVEREMTDEEYAIHLEQIKDVINIGEI